MEQTKYDVFISYSRKDYVDEHKNVIPGNEVSKIKEALTKAGITYWMDEKGIVPGEDFAAKIVKHIKASKIFVYISSKAANESEWTRKEIACALMYKKYLIPVLLDDSPFHDSVMFRIVDLDRIEYYLNLSQGVEKLVSSVSDYLEKEKVAAAQKADDEKRKQEALERQRKQQEEEKKRQEKIERIEAEISALESQKVEREKAVLQKEQELKFAQVDLKACEAKILKLQAKLEKVRSFKKEEKRDGVFTVNGVSFEMIRVDGGTFMMGATNEQGSYVRDVEKPVHQVTLSDYYIGETQVTQELWQAVMGSNPSSFKGASRPVENVSWDDCQEFISQLNKQTGKRFRLLTEAEWEFAARGGKKSNGYKYAGSDYIDDVAWYDDNSGYETHPVGQKQPNELGLYDMSGNVFEWCQDWYGDYSSNAQTNPTGPESGSCRVLRGGNWGGSAGHCSSTYRGGSRPSKNYIYYGLRLAL